MLPMGSVIARNYTRLGYTGGIDPDIKAAQFLFSSCSNVLKWRYRDILKRTRLLHNQPKTIWKIPEDIQLTWKEIMIMAIGFTPHGYYTFASFNAPPTH